MGLSVASVAILGRGIMPKRFFDHTVDFGTQKLQKRCISSWQNGQETGHDLLERDVRSPCELKNPGLVARKTMESATSPKALPSLFADP